jgi:hypothetical protein
MANKWYYKELFSNPYLIEGAPAPFEQLEGNRGVLVLDTEKDGKLISALDEAAAKRRGGIQRISEATYIEKKNNLLPPRLNAPSRQKDEIKVMPRDLSPQPKADAAVAGTDKEKSQLGPDGFPLFDKQGLRLDGPTLEEYVSRGYDAKGYPPHGYAVRTTPRVPAAAPSAPASAVSIPSPDSSDKKEQGQGAPPTEPKSVDGQPPRPASFKPATRRIGADDKSKAPEGDKPAVDKAP